MTEKLPIFALHGWGLNAAVLEPLDGAFDGHRVQAVDLPGHGRRREESFGRDLDALVEGLLAQAPPRAVWLGWSLGGMLALTAASVAPDRVAALVTVAASPSFVKRPDWPEGMPVERLRRMAADLASDAEQTVNDFLTLQVLSSRDGRTALRQLKAALDARGMASSQALDDGLHLLETLDLQPHLAGLKVSLLATGGGRDRLVQPAAIRAMAKRAAVAEAHIFDDAAHAPFLSDRAGFIACMTDFLQRRGLA
ncbi:MAG: pimeloyl-ACP methyl ester esterase BioH [Gammaproteobacteria bacterium]